MSDNLNLTDGRDKAWVALEQDYEVRYAAEQFLRLNGYKVDETGIAIVKKQILLFPDTKKSQGRVPRAGLMEWLKTRITAKT